MDLNQDTLYIFTDGSCYPNPGPGGWAALLVYNGHLKFHYGGSENETNNTMELRAILEGLKVREDRMVPTVLYTDSMYCVNVLTKWWKGWERNGWVTGAGKPVKNQKYIREILQYTENVEVKWMKGHNGNCFNDAADMLARKGRASVEKTPGEDPDMADIQTLINPYVPPPSEKKGPPFKPDDFKTAPTGAVMPALEGKAVTESEVLRDVLAGVYFMQKYGHSSPDLLVEQGYDLADKFIAWKLYNKSPRES